MPDYQAEVNISSNGIGGSFDVCVSGVCFTYEGNSGPALKNVSIAATAGKTVALVGPSGGVDIRCIRKEVLMRTVSCVFQYTSLFKASVLHWHGLFWTRLLLLRIRETNI
jgi:ABC-type multidrug transport system fused ATPase/permease subunit